MSDASVTCASAICVNKLVARARARDAEATNRVLDLFEGALGHPERRVSAALTPKQRGGDPDAERRAERNAALQDLALAVYDTALLTHRQAAALNRKAQRLLNEAEYTQEGGGTVQQEAARRIRASGLGLPGDRQLHRILNRRAKKSDKQMGDCLSASIVTGNGEFRGDDALPSRGRE